jgi:4-amino-4-deoxy-L-arabinose transferase-like glycosyltransferase
MTRDKIQRAREEELRLSRAQVLGLAVLAIVTALAFIVRIPSIAEPLGIDQGLLASAARELSRGQMLYRDIWDQKPPGIYFAYLAAFTSFGWEPSSVAWFDILASVATAALIFGIARRLDGVWSGAVASMLYATLTMPSWLYRHGGFLERSVAETYMVVCLGVAAWCAVRLVRGATLAFAAGLGLSAGAALMFKPNAAVYLPAFLLWAALYMEGGLRRIIAVFVVAGVSTLVVSALVLAWLWSHDVLADARVALVDFNRAYVATGFSIRSYAIDFPKAVWLRMKTDPLWAAGGIATLAMLGDFLRRRKLDPLPALTVAWGGAAVLAIVVNGARLFNSYFIQALAPLSILAAWHLVAAARGSSPRRVLGLATVAIMGFMLLVRSNYPGRVYEFAHADLEQLLGTGDRTPYLEIFGGYGNERGYSARANEELADYVKTRTHRDDLIYLFGINGAGVYFAADRLAAQKFLRVNMFVQSDLADPRFRLPAVTQELAAKRPAYLIFERLHSPSAMGRAVDALEQDPDIQRLLESYRRETQIEDFTLYRRLN